MTVICAQRVGGEVWIGSDSRLTSGTYLYPFGVQKFVTSNGWRIGASGSMRFYMFLRTKSLLGKNSADEVAFELWKWLAEDEWKPEPDTGPRVFKQQFVLVSPDLKVFELPSTGSILDAGEEFIAIGSGCEFAQGAAYALSTSHPHHRMNMALAAACKYDTACGGDLYVECLRQEKVGRPVPQAPGVAEQTAASKNIPFGAWSR